MLRRYELTDEEWNRIAPLLPPKNTGKQGRPRKDTRTILNGMVQLARSGAPWRDLPERYGSWQTVYSRFRKWIDDGILDNIFRTLSLETELEDVPEEVVPPQPQTACMSSMADKRMANLRFIDFPPLNW